MVRRLFAGGEWLRTSRSARDRQRFEAWAELRPIDCRAGGIDFAACQDEATNGVCITPACLPGGCEDGLRRVHPRRSASTHRANRPEETRGASPSDQGYTKITIPDGDV
jgi:hypothetical protein